MTDLSRFSAMQLVRIYNVVTDGKEVRKFETAGRGRERLAEELGRLGVSVEHAVTAAVNAGVVPAPAETIVPHVMAEAGVLADMGLTTYRGRLLVVFPSGAVIIHADDGGVPGDMLHMATDIDAAKAWVDASQAPRHLTSVTNLANGETLPRPQLHGPIRSVVGSPEKAARAVAKAAGKAARVTAEAATLCPADDAETAGKWKRSNASVPAMLALLSRPEGATLAELTVASGWQAPVEVRNLRIMERKNDFSLTHDGAAGEARRYRAVRKES